MVCTHRAQMNTKEVFTMFNSHTLRPETINILGGTQQTHYQRTTAQYSEAQEESTSKKTGWGKFKDKTKKTLEKLKDNISEMNGITESDAFSCGFRLGVRLMAEVFTTPMMDME